MTFNAAEAMRTLAVALRDGTTNAVGDGGMPETVPERAGYGILEQMPGAVSSGGMEGNMEMATLLFNLKTVGRTHEQCRLLRQRFYGLLDTSWPTIAGCMGPLRLVGGGIVTADQRTFEANDTIYMEVTE